MNIALTIGHPAAPAQSQPQAASAPLAGRSIRRLGLVLVAWSRSLRNSHPTRAELAEFHRRRQEAERARAENFRLIAYTRLG